MSRFTKKELASHFNDRFFTVEFYHGQRECFYNNVDIVTATNTQLKCTKRGGVCFLFDIKYSKQMWKYINDTEREIKCMIPLDVFRSNIPYVLKEIDEKQAANT